MAVTKIEVLHLNWLTTDRDQRWLITCPTGGREEGVRDSDRAAKEALGTGAYTLVATKVGWGVLADSPRILDESEVLEFAFLQTNHIDRPWNDGQGAFVAQPGSQRSTSVGDIIKVTRSVRGTVKVAWHLVSSFGFEQIICTTRQQPTASVLDAQGGEALHLAACYPHLYS